MYKGNCPEVKKDILKNFVRYSKKHRCCSIFFINLFPEKYKFCLKEALTPVNFENIFREKLFYEQPVLNITIEKDLEKRKSFRSCSIITYFLPPDFCAQRRVIND